MTTSPLVTTLEASYQQAQDRATQARAALTQEVEQAALTRSRSRHSNDSHVARLCHIATLYQDLLAHPEEQMDHSILTEPYFGTLSLLDQVHLLEGDEQHSPGIATLDLEGYGMVLPTTQGWNMILDGEHFALTGEMMHQILVENTQARAVPFTNPGVLPTTEWRAHFDGMAVVVPPRSFVTREGEECEIKEPIRLSLYYERYAALVWSVCFERYQMEEFQFHGEVTHACFEEQRVPENALEAQFWHDNLVWRGWSEEDQKKAFLPGRKFAHLTSEAMGNIKMYKKLQQKMEERRGKEYSTF